MKNFLKNAMFAFLLLGALGVNLVQSGEKQIDNSQLSVEVFSNQASAQLEAPPTIPGVLWYSGSMCNCPWPYYSGCGCVML